MKRRVKVLQLTRQRQTVSSSTHPGSNRERTNPLLAKLTPTRNMQVCSGKEHQVPNGKHNIAPVPISIGLLGLLCASHGSTSGCHSLLHAPNKVPSSLDTGLCPQQNVNRLHQLLPKNQLSWRATRTLRYTRIQSKLHLPQQSTPTLLQGPRLTQETPERLLQSPVRTLGLAICLWVMGRAKGHLAT